MTFLLRGARVVDLDRGGSLPVDVRIRDGVIIEVGPDLGAAGERVLDGRGGWLIPGLWDKHLHFGQLVRSSTWLDVAGLPGPEAVAARVAVAQPAAGPLIGFGYRSAGWARTGTVAELDAVTGDRVTVLISGDAHTGWLNSAALRAFGLAPRTGPLEEDDWFAIMGRLGCLPGSEPTPAAEAATAATLASRGLTGIVDFEFTDAHLDWPRRIAAGLETLRVRTAVYPHQLDDVLAAGLRTGDPLPGGAGLATMGPLKVISDGSMSTRTAWCCEPYLGDGGHGAPNLTAAELTALLRRSADGGLAVAVHAIGDRANAAALDAFATTGAWGSVEHAQLLRRADVPRFAALGLVASMQPAHLLDDRTTAETLWGDRTDRLFLAGSLLASGADVVLGSDAPVAPADPWLAIAAAVHRGDPGGSALNPAESLTPLQALRASVDGGRIIEGAAADLVLLGDDPLTVGPSAEQASRLRDMTTRLTLCAGRITSGA